MALVGLMLLLLMAGCGSEGRPVARGGVLDLSGYSFAERGPTQLDGEWAFYWGRLLGPGEVGVATPDAYMAVPGAWNGAVIDGEPLPADGYGTYRLEVRLPAAQQSYGLYIRYMSTAYRLWVDGQLVAENGRVGTDAISSVPQFLPRTVQILPQGDTMELVVQVSNFDHRLGGVWNPLQIGLHDQLRAERDASLALTMVLAGMVFIIGVYHLALFFLRRQERAFMYFAVLALAVVTRMMVQGELFLPRLIPTLNWELQLRLEYLSGFLAIYMLARITRYTFSDRPRTAVDWTLTVLWGAMAVATVVRPVRWSSVLILGTEAVVVMWLGYQVWSGFRSDLRRPHQRLFLAGLTIMFLTSVHDILVYNQILHTPRLFGIGTVVLIVVQALAMATQYSKAMREEAQLAAENARLLAVAQAHLQELQRSRHLLTTREEHLRRDIAEVLHGRVQTRLLMAAHRLEEAQRVQAADPAQARVLIQEALRTIDEVREQDVRMISHALHPSVIRVGLVPAVRSLIGSVSGQLKIAFTVDPALMQLDDSLDGGLPESLRLALYRILEEALSNVLAHARAERVAIRLSAVAEFGVELRIEDDGRGFSPGELQPGLGLQSIGARVADMGGTWSLKGAPGEGAILSVMLPLSAPEQPSAIDAPASR